MSREIYLIEDKTETLDSRVLLYRKEQPVKMNLEEIRAANLELRHDLAILKALEAQFQEEFLGLNSPDCTLMKFRYRFEAAVPRFHLPETSAVIPVKINEFSYDGFTNDRAHADEMVAALKELTAKVIALSSFHRHPPYFSSLSFSLEQLGLATGCWPMVYETAHERMAARARSVRLGYR
ncbi:hypothetical protein [Ruegeria arenilitoris]|uniref:hypothetical protein n=1 Tax=Ruegeria arenilitoris TaxID=1173585 RepID=UPI00147E5B7D|nr:hypothetical protein [Ruegeria arenilitoris]